MQLGELQSQIQAFERRGVSVVAVSVDTVQDSQDLVARLGISYEIASDPEQTVVQQFRVQNPETKELALHAVYIVDENGFAVYRKVGRRRPTSVELIDAIDAHRGDYPSAIKWQGKRKSIAVAYPENIFQAIIEISKVTPLPATIDVSAITRSYSYLLARKTDDSLIAFRNLVRSSDKATEGELLQAATWLVHKVFYDDNHQVAALGQELQIKLSRVGQLEDDLVTMSDVQSRDTLLHQLAAARAGLATTRASVSQKSSDWNLNFAKAMLRSYREVAKAASRARE